ncbi:MAG: methyltransferase family protein [Candidatus Ratteibacteria bacterium]
MGKYRNSIIDWFIKKRTTFGWLFFVLIAIFGKGNIKKILIGLPFIILGEFLRIVSSGIIKKNEVLTKNGIYSFLRHPLYFGSFLISIGFSISSNNLLIFIYFFIFFPFIYFFTIKKEEEFLTMKFKEEFEEYKRKVPAFFPKLKKTNIFDGFSLRNFLKNGEILNILTIIFLIFILLIKSNYKF